MSRIRTALGEAMTRLGAADVAGATALIQRALGAGLGAGRADRAADPDAATTRGNETSPPRRRSLAEVVEALRGLRDRFAGSGEAERPAPDDAVALDPRFTRHVFECEAGSVAYKLYVPKPVRGRTPSLVMMLHGCTQNPDDFAQGTRMNALAERHGLIVVYPHQTRAANPHACWNWFDARHQRRGAGEPAVLAGLAQQIAREHGIGRSRTFVAGLSAGGAMADVLAGTYPDVFSAAGIHSGIPYGAAVDVVSAFGAMKGRGLRGPTPRAVAGADVRRIVFHGDADATVHVSNARQILDRATAMLPEADRVITSQAINGRTVTRTLAGAVDGVAHTEHWLIHGAGHAWSGAGAGGSYTDPTGPDASREMIRFFLGD